MKNFTTTGYFRQFIAAIICMSSLFSFSSSATLITLETSSNVVSQHATFDVEIWARNLNTDIVSAFDLDIAIDDTAIGFQSSSFGAMLGSNIDSIQDTFDFGKFLNIAEISFLFDADLAAIQAGADFMLASLSFSANKVGITQLSLLRTDVVGANAQFLSIDNTTPLTINITANDIPEPSMMAIFLLAICLGRILHKNSQLPG